MRVNPFQHLFLIYARKWKLIFMFGTQFGAPPLLLRTSNLFFRVSRFSKNKSTKFQLFSQPKTVKSFTK